MRLLCEFSFRSILFLGWPLKREKRQLRFRIIDNCDGVPRLRFYKDFAQQLGWAPWKCDLLEISLPDILSASYGSGIQQQWLTVTKISSLTGSPVIKPIFVLRNFKKLLRLFRSNINQPKPLRRRCKDNTNFGTPNLFLKCVSFFLVMYLNVGDGQGARARWRAKEGPCATLQNSRDFCDWSH